MLKKQLMKTSTKQPYDILKTLSLGNGREEVIPASMAKKQIASSLKKKHMSK